MDARVGSAQEWEAIIVRFLQDHLKRSGADGFVVGISGGLDSAVTAALCVRAVGVDRVFGIRMPHQESDPDDAAFGESICNHLKIPATIRDITPIVSGVEDTLGHVPSPHVHGNAKARARMMVLYAEAQSRNFLVCGTGNKSELLVGYFTKYGDGGVDLEPIGDLYKTQVVTLARHLGLPEDQVIRTPTAGLQPGQTDEEDLGMSYGELDSVLKCMEMNTPATDIPRRSGVDAAHVARVEHMVRRSEHKRHAPLVPKIGSRTVGIDWRRPVHWDA